MLDRLRSSLPGPVELVLVLGFDVQDKVLANDVIQDDSNVSMRKQNKEPNQVQTKNYALCQRNLAKKPPVFLRIAPLL